MTRRTFWILPPLFIIGALVGPTIIERVGYSRVRQLAVPDLAALRPATADDTLLAAFFDRPGTPMAQAPNQAITVTPIYRPKAPQRAADYLRPLVCNADIVLLGTPASQRVLLNRSETALFTKYQFDVSQWIRRAVALPASVVMSDLGGVVKIGVLEYGYDTGASIRAGRKGIYFGKTITGTTSFHRTAPEIPIVDGSPDYREHIAGGLSAPPASESELLELLQALSRACGN